MGKPADYLATAISIELKILIMFNHFNTTIGLEVTVNSIAGALLLCLASISAQSGDCRWTSILSGRHVSSVEGLGRTYLDRGGSIGHGRKSAKEVVTTVDIGKMTVKGDLMVELEDQHGRWTLYPGFNSKKVYPVDDPSETYTLPQYPKGTKAKIYLRQDPHAFAYTHYDYGAGSRGLGEGNVVAVAPGEKYQSTSFVFKSLRVVTRVNGQCKATIQDVNDYHVPEPRMDPYTLIEYSYR